MNNTKKAVDGKKERLFLCGSLALVLAAGISFELIKVPVELEEQEVDIVPASKMVTLNKEEETTSYLYKIPNGYTLKLDSNGEPYGYKETIVVNEKTISLADYIEYKLAGVPAKIRK